MCESHSLLFRWTVVLGSAIFLFSGALVASNMGFKISRELLGANNPQSATGFNALALPYYRKANLDMASALLADLGPAAAQLQRFDPADDSFSPYPGPGGDFPLASGHGYLVQIGTDDTVYNLVGSHAPTLELVFYPKGANSATGFQFYAPPYHSVASTASELLAEIGPAAAQLQRFHPVDDSFSPYPGPGGDFPLVPGEAYLLQVTQEVSYTPIHY